MTFKEMMEKVKAKRLAETRPEDEWTESTNLNTYKLVYIVRGQYECWFVDATNVSEAIKINHRDNHRSPKLLEGYETI